MADIKEAIRRMIYQYTVEGADKVMETQEAVAASTTRTDKASLSLEKSFGSIERRYVDTVRAQQEYQKVQEKVNAAVAQNPALQERANTVLAQAKQHFDNMATGASKGSAAATILARTLMRTIGPLALVAAAVAAMHSALEFFEPIAIRAASALASKFEEAVPAVGRVREAFKQLEAEVELEHVRQKSEAVAAALNGVASAAQLAALKLQSVNEKLVSDRSAAELAQQLERAAEAALRLGEAYPGVTLETAKQLDLMDDQLAIAKARGEQERLTAEEIAEQNRLLAEGLSIDEAYLLAAKKREIAQANLNREAEKLEPALDKAGDTIERNIRRTNNWGSSLSRLRSIAEQVDNRLSLLHTQFGSEKYEIAVGGRFAPTAAAYEDILKRLNASFAGVVTATQNWADSVVGGTTDLVASNTDLAASTDSLNATMQSALSPFYSQDPRTTHLGFRAGVVGNPDWQAAGASNENPLAAILGSGATAPGMANGGSFMVGGGYSANDNRIAAFPVASGEEVIVNRNRKGGQAGQVIHIDNRTIINGRVDADVFAQMKVSKYQQTQRMRAGLAVA